MFPIVVESETSWLESLIKFVQELRREFKGRLKKVIALPSPEMRVYDSNVLVVLDRYDLKDVDLVVELALKVDERINPLVSSEEEGDVKAFLGFFLSSWPKESLIKFVQELRREFKGRLKKVIALPSPEMRVYDSNVLVVLDRYDLKDVDLVVELALKVDERINPLVSSEEEGDVKAFLGEGGVEVEGCE